jgi:hypothetical protein
MDAKPYFQFDIRTITNNEVKELSKYGKPDFKLDDILSAATELKYTSEIKRYFAEQFQNPEDSFVKCIIKGIGYQKNVWANVLEDFKPVLKNALAQFLNDKLNERLSSAIKEDDPTGRVANEEPKELGNDDNSIVTTQDKIDAYNIVKAILRRHVPVSDISFHDAKSYSTVLYKGKNYMTICRLYFNNPSNLQIALIDASDKTRNKVKLESLDDIFSHEETLVKTLKTYQESSF